jgi:hypothetical protein
MNRNMASSREEGQSLIIIGALLLVLVALIGLVVDAGNAYAQRRIIQNAVDAGALAGALQLAHQDDWKADPTDPSLYLYNFQVIDAVEDFAQRNGADPQDLSIYYADIDGNVLKDAKFELAREDTIQENTFGAVRAEALIVEGSRNFPTYLVRVIGRNEMTAHANAMGVLACGACTAGGDDEGLFPIAVHIGLFDDTGGKPVMGRTYRIWNKDPEFPGTGSFGWLSWNTDGGHTSDTTLEANMADTCRSDQWSVGDSIPTGPGVMNSSGVLSELKKRVENSVDLDPPRPMTVTLPIYDVVTGTGESLTYHVAGFGRFKLLCYHFSRTQFYGDSCTFDSDDNDKWIVGEFVKWVEPNGAAGCTNYGVCTATTTTGVEVKRILTGRVVPWQVSVHQGAVSGPPQPVDLVHVVDVSGSMCANWDGSGGGSPCTNSGRLAVAKSVLTGFNDAVNDPAAHGLGDWDPQHKSQVGLVSYPTKVSVPTYNTACGLALGKKCKEGSQADCVPNHDQYYFAAKNKNLTTGIPSVNEAIANLVADGGTSLPRGLQYGREMVTDPLEHNPNNLQVLILTTDGMANVNIDGKASGYRGTYTLPPLIVESGCNDSVYQAAIEQANQAKQAGVIVFTIGIHETIDADLLTAIASPDTHPDKPHFFQAETGDEFEEIYQSILERLPTLGTEECKADENAAVGSNARVYLYDDHGNQVASTWTSSTGDFIFSDIEAGTYELRAVWEDTSVSPSILYDVMTWTLGGEPADQPILVEVPLGKQTTQKDLYLRTDHELTCDE